MNRKNISKHLNYKISEWLDTIKDDNVKRLVEKNIIVTGGSIVSLLTGEKVNDYDIYMRTEEATIAIADYYANLWNSSNEKRIDVIRRFITNIKGETEERILFYIKSDGVVGDVLDASNEEFFIKRKDIPCNKGLYAIKCMTDNSITLYDDIQIIVRFFGDASQIHKNFDFVHAMSYYDYFNRKLVLPQKTLESIITKTLIYEGSLYPVASLFRLRKFINRGWNISAGEIFKIAYQISKVDLNNFDTLKDQLMGVDVSYFFTLLHILKNENKIDSNGHCDIDQNWLFVVIDRIFSGGDE